MLRIAPTSIAISVTANVLDYKLKCGYGIERKDWGLCLRSMGAKQGVSGYETKASVASLLLLFSAPVTLTV